MANICYFLYKKLKIKIHVKNTGQPNPTQPYLQSDWPKPVFNLLKMTRFDQKPVWSATQLTWPVRFAMSNFRYLTQTINKSMRVTCLCLKLLIPLNWWLREHLYCYMNSFHAAIVNCSKSTLTKSPLKVVGDF